ncbi:RNA-directed DNA polymerase, eukaryota, partial [Tanacetum coccineum]
IHALVDLYILLPIFKSYVCVLIKELLHSCCNLMMLDSWFNSLLLASDSFVSDERIVWISLESMPLNALTRNTFARITSVWESEEFVSSEHDSDGEGEEQQKGVLGKESDLEVDNIKYVSESSYMHEYDKVSSSKSKPVHSEDPFGIYSILKRNNQKDMSTGDDLQYPLGFTPGASVEANMDNDNSVRTSQPKAATYDNKGDGSSTHIEGSVSKKIKTGGSLLEVMDELIMVGQAMGYNMEGCIKNIEFIIGLVELPLEGYSFMWSHKSATKISKLDRFLISEGLTSAFPSLSTLCLDRYLSDHRPILLRELNVDYGPTPFWVFHSWLTKEGFDKLVEDTWKNSVFIDSNSVIILKKKL